MLVGDLIYNDNFDCDCNYDIYDCTENEAKLIFSTKRDGVEKPLDKILDMKISHISIENSTIVIEAIH